jgi:hypothetical protein
LAALIESDLGTIFKRNGWRVSIMARASERMNIICCEPSGPTAIFNVRG